MTSYNKENGYDKKIIHGEDYPFRFRELDCVLRCAKQAHQRGQTAAFRINGRVSFPFAASAAVKGKIVNTSVLKRKLEMSEKRVAM